MIHQIEAWLLDLANKIPVEIFIALGSAIEEIIAPIPSPIVMTMAGSIAQAQQKTYIYILFLALIGSIAKTIASWIVYFISDKAEDILISSFGKLVGIKHKEVEKIGSYFRGDNKDILIMAAARAIPIIPTAPVSIVSGIIKLNIKTYILGTAIGTFIRNIIYLFLGFAGASTAQNILNGLDSLESVVQLLLVVVGLTVLAVLFYRREKQKDFWSIFKKWTKK